MIPCPHCGELNAASRKTCFRCRKLLRDPSIPERRMMCSMCSAVYTTSVQHCPRCGGLLRPFAGSAALAEEIKAQREWALGDPGVPATILSFLLPGFGLRAAHMAAWQGDQHKATRLTVYGVISLCVWLVLLLVLLLVL